jgi:uncharacterized membrane protein YcfT
VTTQVVRIVSADRGKCVCGVVIIFFTIWHHRHQVAHLHAEAANNIVTAVYLFIYDGGFFDYALFQCWVYIYD